LFSSASVSAELRCQFEMHDLRSEITVGQTGIQLQHWAACMVLDSIAAIPKVR